MNTNFTIYEKYPQRSPLDICLKLKKYVKNKVVCDIGCGSGDILECLKINNFCKEVKGIEYDINRYVKNREYIIYGDVFIEGIPKADVYFLWQGIYFPFKKFFNTLNQKSIIISGSDVDYLDDIPNLYFYKTKEYDYDETKYEHNDLSYYKDINLRQNSNFTIKGKRKFRIYIFDPK